MFLGADEIVNTGRFPARSARRNGSAHRFQMLQLLVIGLVPPRQRVRFARTRRRGNK